MCEPTWWLGQLASQLNLTRFGEVIPSSSLWPDPEVLMWSS